MRLKSSISTLHNRKILITAGPTREYWDPVRYLSNGSSGQMGIALAEVAARKGAKVTLILGPVEAFRVPSTASRVNSKPGNRHPKRIPVVSARDMDRQVQAHLFGTDIFIGAAAVSDYRPANVFRHKIKVKPVTLKLTMHRNPDIIAKVAKNTARRPKTVIGFALETQHQLENANAKLKKKNLDWIVSNHSSTMGSTRGSAILLSRWGDKVVLNTMSKGKLAERIWQTILKTGTRDER